MPDGLVPCSSGAGACPEDVLAHGREHQGIGGMPRTSASGTTSCSEMHQIGQRHQASDYKNRRA